MKSILDKKLLYFLGAYLSFFIFIICAARDMDIGEILFKVLTISFFIMFLFKGNSAHKIDLEKAILLLFGVILCVFMLIRGKVQGEHAAFDIVCIFALFAAAIIYIIQNHRESHIKEWVEKNGIILLVILIFAMLSLEVVDSWFMWDDRTYYAYPSSNSDVQGMLYNFDSSFAGIDGLYLAGHVSLGYSLWLILFQLIKEGSASVQIANIVLAEISILAYYQILKKVLGNRLSNKILSLATIPYAFSPFVLGMVGNLNPDNATMYFWVIFIACSLYQYEALEWTAAFFLCFTKEPAIIYYVIYIIVRVLCDYLKEQHFHWSSLIKYGFGNIRNYIYALPVILWVILKMSNSVWGGKNGWSNGGINCFGIDICFIAMKLKQIFLLNFNWVFWGSIIVGILLAVSKKKVSKTILAKVLPICSVGLTVIAFGCLYITFTNVRYIVPLIPALYLTATIVIASLVKRSAFCTMNIIISILLLIQSYCVIDPIMSNVFDTITVGNGKVYNMQVSGSKRVVANKTFKDSIVYNRQYIYWQETLIETLRKSEYDGNMLIVLPDSYNCLEFSLLGEKNGIALWNKQKKSLDYYNENIEIPEYCTLLKGCHAVDVDQVFDGSNILYIIPRWADIDGDFVSNKNIIRYGEVDNKGFNIKYMVMSVGDSLPLADGNYMVSPKQDSTLGICANAGNGDKVFLQRGGMSISLEAINNIVYHLNFGEYEVALDVPRAQIDSDGTVQVWKTNSTSGQRWVIEETDGYYMICFKGYALTYNLEDNSVKLSLKTGEDNQLWSFAK